MSVLNKVLFLIIIMKCEWFYVNLLVIDIIKMIGD